MNQNFVGKFKLYTMTKVYFPSESKEKKNFKKINKKKKKERKKENKFSVP